MSEEMNKSAESESRWYVVHTYSGYENKVKANIEKIVENSGMQDQIHEVSVQVPVSYTHIELELVLRNNITIEERPLGVYHPNPELHHIKKENIGLIEVMGLAVLPSRLKKELTELESAIITGKDLRENELTAKHADWAEKFLAKYDDVNISNIDEIVKNET